MKASTYLITLLMLLGGAGQALAQEEFDSFPYGGLQYGLFDLQQGDVSAEPEGIRTHLGWQWHKHFAIEAHLGFGAQEDSARAGTTNIDVDIDTYYGIYLRGILPIGDRFNLFALAGYSSLEVENLAGGSVGGSLEDQDDDDYSYGIGADFRVLEKIYITVDYMRLIDTDTFEAETLSAGVRYDF